MVYHWESKNEASVNWIIWLLLSLLIQPKVMQLSGRHCSAFGIFLSVDQYKVSRIFYLCPKYSKIHQFGGPLSIGALGCSPQSPCVNSSLPFGFETTKQNWPIRALFESYNKAKLTTTLKQFLYFWFFFHFH